jgi:hypothetical protein
MLSAGAKGRFRTSPHPGETDVPVAATQEGVKMEEKALAPEVESVDTEVVQPLAMADPSTLSIDELEALLDAKRRELGKGVQAEGMLKPPGKAPTGYIWLYNRGPDEFEWQHNSIVYKIDGHSFGLFPAEVAVHGKTRSLLTVDTLTNVAAHQLALPTDKTYGRPLTRISRIEVIDRRTNNNPAQLSSGEKTHIAVLTVEGAEVMIEPGSRQFSELA